jgi:hypothetical protein
MPERLAVEMQREHALVQYEHDQINALRIDLQRRIQLVNAAIALHSQALLQTDRFAECRGGVLIQVARAGDARAAQPTSARANSPDRSRRGITSGSTPPPATPGLV